MVMLSFRLWKPDTEWTLVWIFVPNKEARALGCKIGDVFP